MYQLRLNINFLTGLLAGAVLTMKPDLFKVVWAQVPFLVSTKTPNVLIV